MRKRSLLITLSLAVVTLALLALACQEAEEEPTPTPTATATTVLTPTPAPTPTPTAVVLSSTDFATPGPFKVGVTSMTFIDPSRPIMASGDFPGTPDRRIDTVIWYPADTTEEGVVPDAPLLTRAGPFPLVISSHGLAEPPDGHSYLTVHLASHGFIVAAPTFPLTSLASFTGVSLERRDTGNQPGDVRFVIDRMLASYGDAIDPDRIGALGLSLGAITTYFATFGEGLRDGRIKASVLMATGDPSLIVETEALGLQGVTFADVSVPALFLGASRDLLIPFDSGSLPAFQRTRPPKFLAKIIGGTHIWFSDSIETFREFGNPDLGACQFVGRECVEDGQAPLIDPNRQHELAKIVVTAFLDAFLKDDAEALQFLHQRVQEENQTDLEFTFVE